MITYVSTVSTSASSISAVTDMAERTGTSEMIIVGSGADLAHFNVSTGATSQTALGASGPYSLCVVGGGASAVLFSTSVTSIKVVELSSSYVTTLTGYDSVAYTKPQLAAAQGNICVASALTATKIIKFDASSQTGAATAVDWLGKSSELISSVIAATNGNFLIGTSEGNVFEITTALAPVRSLNIPRSLRHLNYASPSTSYPFISGLAMYGDLVLVAMSDGSLATVHWSSQDILDYRMVTDGVNSPNTSNIGSALTLTNTASGEVIINPFYTNGNFSVVNLDFSRGYVKVRDICYDATANTAPGVKQLHVGQGKILMYRADSKLLLFTFTPSTTNSLVSSSIFDNSAYQHGRVIRVIDPGSPGAYVETDATVNGSSTTYSTKTGQTVLEFAAYDEGTDEKASLSVYQT